jgi:hypothetical protein
VKIDAEKSPFLVERLSIVMLPSILCIKDGRTEHTIVGFDEMGVRGWWCNGVDFFNTS